MDFVATIPSQLADTPPPTPPPPPKAPPPPKKDWLEKNLSPEETKRQQQRIRNLIPGQKGPRGVLLRPEKQIARTRLVRSYKSKLLRTVLQLEKRTDTSVFVIGVTNRKRKVPTYASPVAEDTPPPPPPPVVVPDAAAAEAAVVAVEAEEPKKKKRDRRKLVPDADGYANQQVLSIVYATPNDNFMTTEQVRDLLYNHLGQFGIVDDIWKKIEKNREDLDIIVANSGGRGGATASAPAAANGGDEGDDDDDDEE